MHADYMITSALVALAITSVGCVRFDGLEEDLSVYGVGAAGASADGGGTCTPQTDAQLCGSRNCGAFAATDNCGQARTVASCGACTGVNSCGGSVK